MSKRNFLCQTNNNLSKAASAPEKSPPTAPPGMYAIFADDRLGHRPGCAPSSPETEPIPKAPFESKKSGSRKGLRQRPQEKNRQ